MHADFRSATTGQPYAERTEMCRSCAIQLPDTGIDETEALAICWRNRGIAKGNKTTAHLHMIHTLQPGLFIVPAEQGSQWHITKPPVFLFVPQQLHTAVTDSYTADIQPFPASQRLQRYFPCPDLRSLHTTGRLFNVKLVHGKMAVLPVFRICSAQLLCSKAPQATLG